MKKISGALSAVRMLSIFAIGVSFAIAQQPAGTIRTWGDNFENALGAGLAGNSSQPQSVPGLTDVISVAVGSFHSLAVKSDGSVWAWGGNDDGQLGIGSIGPSLQGKPLPVPVPALGPGSGVIAVAAGARHSLALKSDGSVLAWGLNGFNQLGVDDGHGSGIVQSPVPVAVTGLGPGSGIIAIAAGGRFSLALKSDGSVLAWGSNVNAELGGGAGTPDSFVPVTVMGLGPNSGVVAIATGFSFGMALKSDGAVVAWGDNNHGQVGSGSQSFSSLPTGVSGLGSGSGVIAIGAGGFHGLALKSDGSVLAWGLNSSGQLGSSTPAESRVPLAVSGLLSPTPPVGRAAEGSGSGVVAVSGGAGYSLVVKSDGSMLAWGANPSGELGDGTTTPRPTPAPVVNLNGAVTLALGPDASHNLVIVQPLAALSPNSLNFGDQLVGTLSGPQMITIQNKGQDPLTINSFSLSGASAGDFKISANPTPLTVSPGASTAVSVAFSPAAAFARLATLLVNDNGYQGPQLVALTGNGLLQADIAVALGASPTPVHNDKNLTYTISVKNGGPSSAPAVVMNDALPTGTAFVSSKTTQGTCLTPAPGTTGVVTCNLGTLNSGAAATITLVVTVNAPGGSTLVNTVSATAGAPDPNLGNNSITVVTPVFGSKH